MNNEKITILTLATTIIALSTFGIHETFATHDKHKVADFEWHIWSRNSTEGHTGLLNCDSNNQKCAVKIKTDGSIQNIPEMTIQGKVDSAETVFDNLRKNMSIDRVTIGTKNVIKEGNLNDDQNGKAIYDLHCTSKFLIWCNGEDMHFVKMTVILNDNPSEIQIKDFENKRTTPKTQDIDKILRHELFHAMGIDHNSAKSSIVFHEYVFGSNGLTPSSTDIADLQARYP